ncbi:hypothetical protein ALC56_12823 [Trachymyrmex septentrionalis]|uniref:Uncharacterized protein n=1 Tax=Trachymyrmex septentrionalis TaxID=34720 RepID=A0A195EX63_9HYME|nr:hypothetical protein ALC56_12823 [Trachymyrmex septentrionalis]
MRVLIPPFSASLQNIYSGAKIIEIAAFIAACAFNEGYSSTLKISIENLRTIATGRIESAMGGDREGGDITWRCKTSRNLQTTTSISTMLTNDRQQSHMEHNLFQYDHIGSESDPGGKFVLVAMDNF